MGVRKLKFRLLAFDLDGTLVRDISSWGKLHEYFGTAENVTSGLKAYENGEIDYMEFMRRDIALWPKRVHISTIYKILSNYSLKPDAMSIVNFAKEKGYEVVIISGGIDILVNMVARDLGINNSIANGLAVDEEGYLAGEGILRVDPVNKHIVLQEIAENLGFTIKECIAVGDGKYDKNFLRYAGLGVACGSNEALANITDITISELKELSFILK